MYSSILTLQLYDIRTLKELESYRGHQKDVTCKIRCSFSFSYTCISSPRYYHVTSPHLLSHYVNQIDIVMLGQLIVHIQFSAVFIKLMMLFNGLLREMHR
jgi:hypothetical protein